MTRRTAIITRIPEPLHDQVVALAALHGVSMNRWVERLLEQEVRREQPTLTYEARIVPTTPSRILEVRVVTNAACLHLHDRDTALELVQLALDRIEDENCPRGSLG